MKMMQQLNGIMAWASGLLLLGTASGAQAASAFTVDAEGLRRIEAAVPREATARPRKERRLLVFDRNVGYGGHPSSAYAEAALRMAGERTGAFTTVSSGDPEVFRPERINEFDAVFLNNTVGNLFEDPMLRESLAEFVYRGGGLMGVHGTSVAFTRWPGAHEDWPEFAILLGARGANHRDSTEHVFIELDDPQHSLNRVFGGKDFEYRDEFFRVHEPYSRSRLRVLFRIDVAKTDMEQGAARGQCVRADQDYALAWVRGYGRGRVFYCTIAHNPYVFWDPLMVRFYLDAVQFALGDLPGGTLPSGRLNPGTRAQERLGFWSLAEADGSKAGSLFEWLAHAEASGAACVAVPSGLPLRANGSAVFGPALSGEDRSAVRMALDRHGLRLLAYRLSQPPGSSQAWKEAITFARRMGAEWVLSDWIPKDWSAVEADCLAHEVRLVVTPPGAKPGRLARISHGRGPWMGVGADMSAWVRDRVDWEDAVRPLAGRLAWLRWSDEPAGRPSARVDDAVVARSVRAVIQGGVKPAALSVVVGNADEGSADRLARFSSALVRAQH